MVVWQSLQDYTRVLMQILEQYQELLTHYHTIEADNTLYQAMANNIPNGSLAVIERNFDVVFWGGNELTDFLLPPPEDEMHDASMLEQIIFVRRHYQAAFSGEHVVFEVQYGQKCFVVSAAPIMEQETGEIERIIAVSQNITERKHAENTLRHQAQILEQIHEAICTTDLQGNVLTWNNGAERLTGYSADEVIGKHILRVFHSKAHNYEQILRHVSEHTIHNTIVRGVRKSGEPFVGYHSLSLSLNSAGEADGFIGYMVDITDQQKTEEELRRTKIFLERVLEATPTVIVSYNLREERIDYASETVQAILGYTAAELQTLSTAELAALTHPDDLEEARRALGEAAQTDDGGVIEHEMRVRKRGETQWRNSVYRVTPFQRDSVGKVTRLLYSGFDITERKRAEREKMAAILENQRLLQELEHQKTASLQAMIEIQEHERSRIARDLHDSVGQMLSLAKIHLTNAVGNSDDLQANTSLQAALAALDSALGETRSISRQLMPAALLDLGLEAALQGLFNAVLASNNLEIEFFHDVKTALSSITKFHLYRIVQEALQNIVKHAEATHVTVNLLEHPDTIVLAIEDNGKGFDRDATFQAGSGMGLRNILTRAAQINAMAHIDAATGAGTAIMVILPKQSENTLNSSSL